jgi:hypothetical protein
LPIAVIGEILEERGMSASNASRQSRANELPCRRRRHAPFRGALRAAGVLAAVLLSSSLLLSSEASAERVSLMNFEGSSARSLRWRVAGALKRAGHKVVSPPKTDNPAKLRVFAKRRKVDLFIAGSASGGSDGWELTLKMLDSEGEEVGNGVTFSAPSLRAMMKELKVDGQSRIDDAIRDGGAPPPSKAVAKPSKAKEEDAPEEVEIDVDAEAEEDAPPPPAADFAGNERARSAKKKKQASFAFARTEASDAGGDEPSGEAEEEGRGARRSKGRAARPADIDADAVATPGGSSESAASGGEDEAGDEPAGDSQPRTAKATSWSADDDKPNESEPASEDDGRESFLSDSAGGEVGVDQQGTSDSEASSTFAPTIVMGLNAGFVRRTLAYSDDLYGRLRAPSANSWVYRLQAAVYPFAKPVKDRIGLIAGYESEFSGVVRDNAAGTDFGVTFSEIYGGLKLRQPLGVHEVALEGTVGSMQAGLDDPDGLSGVPGFSYTTLRAAALAGLHFGSLAMRGSLGYRLPIGGYGEASEARWFPRMEGSGIEGSLGLEYRITQEVAFDVSATMRRFLLQMNSRPEDAANGTSEVAGGAVDLYVGGYFGLNITL